MIYGIDISNYQGNISDLGSDIDFVIIKVTEGTTYVNPYWQEQRDKARADGKLVIYYHFSDLSNAVAEAQHFINTIGQLAFGEGLALDWETGGYSDAIDSWCAQFITTAKQMSTVTAMFYSNANRINSGPWPRVTALHAQLWEAAYSSAQPNPSPFPVLAIWQFTSSASEQGVSGNVDKDVYYGTRQTLALLGYNADMIPDANHLAALFWAFYGRAPSPGEITAYVGASYSSLIETMNSQDSTERVAFERIIDTGRTATNDDWSGQIASLQTNLKTAQDAASSALADDTATKAQLQDALKQIADLKAKPPTVVVGPTPPVTVQKSLLQRILGLFGL